MPAAATAGLFDRRLVVERLSGKQPEGGERKRDGSRLINK